MFFARGAAILAAALAIVRLARGAAAALRATVLAAAFAAVLALPIAARLVPAWHTSPAATAEPAGDAIAIVAPVAERDGAATTVTAAEAAAQRGAATGASIPWRAALLAIWLLGAAALGSRAVVGAMRTRRIARRGRRLDVSHVRVAWRALGGSGAAPAVIESDEIDAPIVVGAFAPVVVVPAAARDWDAERWRVVLLHELAHVRRRDGLANLVAQLACAVHWIDPLAHVARRWWREAREQAADDAVLRDGARASSYAEHLLAIASEAARPGPAAALAMTDAQRLESRIEALFADRPRAAAGRRRGLAVAIGAGLAAVIAAGFAPESVAAPSLGRTGGKAPPGATRIPPSTVVPALQAAAEQELARAVAAHPASGSIAIVLDAKTGAILAMVGEARTPRIPGSTLKPFTIAAALDAGAIKADARIDCDGGVRAYGKQQLKDSSPHGVLDVGGILAVSSNVGVAKIGEPLGDKLASALRAYGLPAPAHLDTRSFDGAAIAAGEGLNVSPLQLASAYTSFATDGIYRAADGASNRVMTAETARAVAGMLARVVDDPDGTGHAARISGVRVAGKTGTAGTATPDRYYASFVGIVPADAPRYVILVAFDHVDGGGGNVAAPAFAALATRVLAGR
jgi:beta-lactamase regulating signal transducer with metallopeptidase domain